MSDEGKPRRAFNSTLPAPTKPMKRSGPLAKVGRNAKKRFTKAGWKLHCSLNKLNPFSGNRRPKKRPDVYGAYHKWIKGKPCILAGHPKHKCDGAVTGHHIRHVKNGGKDMGNEVPLCEGAHTKGPHAIHGPNSGKASFERFWSVNLTSLAADYEKAYRREVA